MPPEPSGAYPAVTFWRTDGPRAGLDRLLDAEVRAVLGAGRWTRRCEQCGSDRHGGRVFVPASSAPVAVGVAHAGRRHVAVTAWTREPVAVDLEHRDRADQLQGSGPLFAGDTDDDPGARLRAWVAYEAAAKLRGGLGADDRGDRPFTETVDAGDDYHCVVAAPFPFAYSAR